MQLSPFRETEKQRKGQRESERRTALPVIQYFTARPVCFENCTDSSREKQRNDHCKGLIVYLSSPPLTLTRLHPLPLTLLFRTAILRSLCSPLRSTGTLISVLLSSNKSLKRYIASKGGNFGYFTMTIHVTFYFQDVSPNCLCICLLCLKIHR